MPRRCRSLAICLLGLAIVSGCAGFKPSASIDYASLFDTQTLQQGDLTITVGLPAGDDTEAIYGVDLAAAQIQPVWLKVANAGTDKVWFLPSGLDPDYFSPSEAAFAFYKKNDISTNLAIARHFNSLAFQNPIMPGASRSGFVLSNLDDGIKVVDIDLLSNRSAHMLTFFLEVPGFQGDYKEVDLDTLYDEQSLLLLDDETGLRRYLESLPCCAANSSGEPLGDPLNIVFIGDRDDVFSALLRRNWHMTERLWFQSMLRTTSSYLKGSRYRYSPVSPLYLYGRKQDVSLQKIRGSINERNHMRLWLSPSRFNGKEVWVGQISRDIGVKYTLKSPTISTHEIDPDVDDARTTLMEDLVYSQNIARIGAVEGVGVVDYSAPRTNLVGDPYYTDGLRAVMFLGPRQHSIADVDWVKQWVLPNQSAMGYSRQYTSSTRYREALSEIASSLRPIAITKSSGDISVSLTITSAEDNEAILGINPLEHGIQTVWLEVSNHTDRQLGLMQSGLDPDYLSPLELAHAHKKAFSHDENESLAQHLQALDFRDPILAGETVSGFVHINGIDARRRLLAVDLVGDLWAQSFTFVVDVPRGSGKPRLTADSLIPQTELVYLEDETELRQALQNLPCCVSLEPGDHGGEPLNLILIGELDTIELGFGRRGYKSYQLEPRFAFGRLQDTGGIRQSQWISSQPHAVRIWLTQLVYRGQPVWLAQTSNRAGGRFVDIQSAGRAAALDPYVDEARADLLQDLVYSQTVGKQATIYGAGREFDSSGTSAKTPLNYITDGRRVVLFFQREPVTLDQIEVLDWDYSKLVE